MVGETHGLDSAKADEMRIVQRRIKGGLTIVRCLWIMRFRGWNEDISHHQNANAEASKGQIGNQQYKPYSVGIGTISVIRAKSLWGRQI
jgi:hypothetical protein